MCTKVDSTICFCMHAPYTDGVAEAAVMFTKEDSLKYEYLLNHKWAVTRMVQSYDSDKKLAYIHGFDAGMELLCAKARLSHPEIAESVKELAGKIAEETAETLRSLTSKKKVLASKIALRRG
jgi:hypothetical protein